jgi:hypothetical protein
VKKHAVTSGRMWPQSLQICSTLKSILCLGVVLALPGRGHATAGPGAQNTTTPKADFVKICKADSGHLSLSPRSNLIQSITEGGDNAKQITETVFVQHNREFKFQCVYTKGNKGNKEGSVPQIDFKPGTQHDDKHSNSTS